MICERQEAEPCRGHTGAVWYVDADRDTNHVLTGSTDNSCHLRDCETGKQLVLLRPTQLPEPVTLTLGTTPPCSPQTSRRDTSVVGASLIYGFQVKSTAMSPI